MVGLFADRRTRHMILLLMMTEFFWGMGAYFVLPTTTVPTYLKTLGAPAIIQGVTYVAFCSLPMLLGLFSRAIIERFPHRKRGLVILHFIAITPYLLVPLLDHLLAGRQNALLMALIILLLGISQLTLGAIAPAWLDMIAQVIPPSARGRYFGLAAGFVSVGGIFGGSALIGLQHWLGTGVFHGAFLATAICYSIGMLMFWLAPIHETTFDHPPEPALQLRLRKALAACHLRLDFGRFVAGNSLQALAVAILPFLVIYATDLKGLHLPQGIFSTLTLLQALGGATGAFALGWWADHRGARWPWLVMTLFIPLIVLLYPLGTLAPILILCTLLVGMLNSGWAVSVPALLEYSPDGDKSGYIAIANLIGFPFALAGPLLIGSIIEGNGYPMAFIMTGVTGLAAFAISLAIRGRRQMSHPHQEVTVDTTDQ